MKQSARITLCGMIAALSAVFMLASFFPYLTYAIPAITGLLIMIIVIELNLKWALGTYIAASVLIFLFAETEAKLMYIMLFGYYPIVKALIERISKPAVEWILKIIVFNAAVIFVYFVTSRIFDLSLEQLGDLGKYGAYITLGLGNVAFVVYDIAVSRMASFYMVRLHPQIAKLFRIKG